MGVIEVHPCDIHIANWAIGVCGEVVVGWASGGFAECVHGEHVGFRGYGEFGRSAGCLEAEGVKLR